MAKQPTQPPLSAAPASRMLQVASLDFDRENPRFPSKIANGPVPQLLERFIRDERLLEIVESIGDHGFFPGEPLLVTKEKNSRYKVVEGNRRLAALKLLTGEHQPPEGRTTISNAVKEAKNRPASVPCLVFEAEDDVLRYLGFRHITGVKAWSALQKARYAQRLWSHYQHLPQDQGLKLLARETGSRSDYMGQMLTTLALYDKAESQNFFKLGLSPDDIEFSVLSTALSYSAISEYLGIGSRTSLDIDGLKPSRLKDLFEWLFVTVGSKKAIVSESRNLRKLAAVVGSDAAVKELRASGNLDDAYELSKGPEIALSEALKIAERRLDVAYRLIPKVLRLNDEHLRLSLQIAKLAASVRGTIDAQLLEPEIPVSRPLVIKRRKPNA